MSTSQSGTGCKVELLGHIHEGSEAQEIVFTESME